MHLNEHVVDPGSAQPQDTNAGRTRPMHWLKKVMTTASVAAVMLVGAGVAMTGTAAAGGTYAGCPYGAVCIYPGASFSGTPLKYYSYGAHNLSNQYGVHRVFNNQYGGAIMRTCTGYSGTGCQGVLSQYRYIDKNLTPINSIVLQPHA